jgi:hypothetical protein
MRWSCVAPIADGMGLFHAVTSCTAAVVSTSTPEMLLIPPAAFATALTIERRCIGGSRCVAGKPGTSQNFRSRIGTARKEAAAAKNRQRVGA